MSFTLKESGTLDVQRCLDCPFYESLEEGACGADVRLDRVRGGPLQLVPAARTDMNTVPEDCPLRNVVIALTYVHPEVRGVH